jgi:hypothetical protein
MQTTKAKLGAEVIARLKPPSRRFTDAQERAFARLDHEVCHALADDPERRGIVRRAIWAARDAVTQEEVES